MITSIEPLLPKSHSYRTGNPGAAALAYSQSPSARVYGPSSRTDPAPARTCTVPVRV